MTENAVIVNISVLQSAYLCYNIDSEVTLSSLKEVDMNETGISGARRRILR